MEKIILGNDVNRYYYTTLKSLYEKNYDLYIDKVIKKGARFWQWDNELQEYELITVTYTRSGVYFYVSDAYPEERYAHMCSFLAGMLYPEVLDLNEYIKYLDEVYDDDSFAKETLTTNGWENFSKEKILTTAEWDTHDGRVKIIPLKNKKERRRKKK